MMLLALLALFLTVSLGIYLALGHSGQSVPLARQLTDLHLSWGLLGWVLLLVIGVAYQVIPMFQITEEYPVLHQRWMLWLVFIALLALSIKHITPLGLPLGLPHEAVNAVAAILLSGCIIIFAITTLHLLHKRRRQLADTTMMFWQLAMISLLSLTLAWAIPTLMHLEKPVFLLGTLMIYGFAMTTINGMMYKIIPFLIWLHLSVHNKKLRDKGERASQVKVPHMRKIIPEAASLWQFRFHLLTLILLSLATIWPLWFFYPAASLLTITQAFLLFNLSNAVLFYNKKLAELASVTQTNW